MTYSALGAACIFALSACNQSILNKGLFKNSGNLLLMTDGQSDQTDYPNGTAPDADDSPDTTVNFDIALTVKNPVSVAADMPGGVPVHNLVYFPKKSAPKSLGALALYDSSGNRVAADFEQVGTLYSNGGIRRVRVTFFVTLSSFTSVNTGTATFHLKNDSPSDGGSTSLGAAPVLVDANGGSFKVVTNGMLAEFDSSRFWLKALARDLNGDGIYSSASGEYLISNQVSTDSMCLKTHPQAGGGVSCDAQIADNQAVIDYHGPNYVVLKYVKAATHSPQRHGHRIYVQIFRNGLIEIVYQLSNGVVATPLPNPLYFESLNFQNTVALPGALQFNYGVQGNVVTKPLNQGYQLKQKSHNVAAALDLSNGAETSAGSTFDGWSALQNANNGVFMFMRYFWQMWPNGFKVQPGKLTAEFFPDWSSQLLFNGNMHMYPGSTTDGAYWLEPDQAFEKRIYLMAYNPATFTTVEQNKAAKVLQFPPVFFQDLPSMQGNSAESTEFGVPPISSPVPESASVGRLPVYTANDYNSTDPEKYRFGAERFGGVIARCVNTSDTGGSYLRYVALATQNPKHFYEAEEAGYLGYANSRPADYSSFSAETLGNIKKADKGPYLHGASYDIGCMTSYKLGGTKRKGTDACYVTDDTLATTYDAPYATCVAPDSMHDFSSPLMLSWVLHSGDRMAIDFAIGLKEYNEALMRYDLPDSQGIGRLMAYVVFPYALGSQLHMDADGDAVMVKYLKEIHADPAQGGYYHPQTLRSTQLHEHAFTMGYFMISLNQALNVFPIETHPAANLEIRKDILAHSMYESNGGDFAYDSWNPWGVDTGPGMGALPTVPSPSTGTASDVVDVAAALYLRVFGELMAPFVTLSNQYITSGLNGGGTPYAPPTYVTSQNDSEDTGVEWKKLVDIGYTKSDTTIPASVNNLSAVCNAGGTVTVSFTDVGDVSGIYKTRVLVAAKGNVTLADVDDYQTAATTAGWVQLPRANWIPVIINSQPGQAVGGVASGLTSGTYKVALMNIDGANNFSALSNQVLINCP